MVSAKNYPALIIAYARPDGVRNLIQSCVANEVTNIYVAIDGPKSKEMKLKQDEIIEVIDSFREIPGLRITVLTREKNLGVGVGVISAIDWFFEQEESGHILEDDLTVKTDFFSFSRVCLDQFSGNFSVYMISGTEITGVGLDGSSVFWSNYPMIWGWSTWRNRWVYMREGLLQKKRLSFSNFFSYKLNYWMVGANRVLDGLVDTWDTPLAAEFLSREWLTVLPPVNLVSNFGDDGNASHTQGGSIGLNLPIREMPKDLDLFSNLNPKSIRNYNHYLENNVFMIRRKHLFLPIYSLLTDRFTYIGRLNPLSQRLKSLVSVESQAH